MIGDAPICVYCQRRIGKTLTCHAFDGGRIPPEIILNDFDHRNKHPEDNGMLFEENPDKPMPEHADPFHPMRAG